MLESYLKLSDWQSVMEWQEQLNRWRSEAGLTSLQSAFNSSVDINYIKSVERALCLFAPFHYHLMHVWVYVCARVCVCVCVLRKEVASMYNWTTVDVRNVSIVTTSLFHEETRGDGAHLISQWEWKLRGCILFLAVTN